MTERREWEEVEFTLLQPDITEYLEQLHGEPPDVVKRMESRAEERNFPIVGRLIGRFLELLASTVRPEVIFELGSGFGYSAYWFSRGYPGVTVHLTDYEEENLEEARGYLEERERPGRFVYHSGPAMDSLRQYDGEIDLLLVDFDKDGYVDALEYAEDRLAPGSWLVADNVLWQGRVADPEETDEETEAIRTFNERIFSESSPWRGSIVPLRDGLLIARREA